MSTAPGTTGGFTPPAARSEPEPRPWRLTPEMALRAAKHVAANLSKAGLIDGDEDGAASDIAKHARGHMDGYKLAKELDSYCHWDCDLMMADELDSFSSYADQEIAEAEKAWAERNGISPTLPIGARVTIKTGEKGAISGIYEHGAAKYLVLIDNEERPGARRIVNFEDATLDAAERTDSAREKRSSTP